ncbi:MAG: aminotransferase class IV [Clostridia bacterium]
MNERNIVIVNGNLCDASEYDALINSQEAYAYEVIRVIEGKPLFLEDHLERLKNTLAGIGMQCDFTAESLRADFGRLCTANGVSSDNVKIIIWEDTVCMMFTGATYPSEEMYRDGVGVGVLAAVRENPQVKISNFRLREFANRMIAENGFFEVMLANRKDCITEGSRSNMFFIKDGVVVTSPAEGVLLGITRKRIISVCEENRVPIEYREIPRKELGDFDAAFISGTSPNVLPIRFVKDGNRMLEYDVNDRTLRRVMKLFDSEIAGYLEEND